MATISNLVDCVKQTYHLLFCYHCDKYYSSLCDILDIDIAHPSPNLFYKAVPACCNKCDAIKYGFTHGGADILKKYLDETAKSYEPDDRTCMHCHQIRLYEIHYQGRRPIAEHYELINNMCNYCGQIGLIKPLATTSPNLVISPLVVGALQGTFAQYFCNSCDKFANCRYNIIRHDIKHIDYIAGSQRCQIHRIPYRWHSANERVCLTNDLAASAKHYSPYTAACPNCNQIHHYCVTILEMEAHKHYFTSDMTTRCDKCKSCLVKWTSTGLSELLADGVLVKSPTINTEPQTSISSIIQHDSATKQDDTTDFQRKAITSQRQLTVDQIQTVFQTSATIVDWDSLPICDQAHIIRYANYICNHPNDDHSHIQTYIEFCKPPSHHITFSKVWQELFVVAIRNC